MTGTETRLGNPKDCQHDNIYEWPEQKQDWETLKIANMTTYMNDRNRNKTGKP